MFVYDLSTLMQNIQLPSLPDFHLFLFLSLPFHSLCQAVFLNRHYRPLLLFPKAHFCTGTGKQSHTKPKTKPPQMPLCTIFHRCSAIRSTDATIGEPINEETFHSPQESSGIKRLNTLQFWMSQMSQMSHCTSAGRSTA